jgi:hypothetical protein
MKEAEPEREQGQSRYCDFRDALRLLSSPERLAAVLVRLDEAGGRFGRGSFVSAALPCSPFGQYLI